MKNAKFKGPQFRNGCLKMYNSMNMKPETKNKDAQKTSGE